MRPTDINWSPIRMIGSCISVASLWSSNVCPTFCGCLKTYCLRPILEANSWVDAGSLITPFKCLITRTQQCLVPKERDRWGGGQIWHLVWSIFGSCHGNQKWKWQWVWVEPDTLHEFTSLQGIQRFRLRLSRSFWPFWMHIHTPAQFVNAWFICPAWTLYLAEFIFVNVVLGKPKDDSYLFMWHLSGSRLGGLHNIHCSKSPSGLVHMFLWSTTGFEGIWREDELW